MSRIVGVDLDLFVVSGFRENDLMTLPKLVDDTVVVEDHFADDGAIDLGNGSS